MERPSDQEVASLLMALVGIDSVNPSLVTGAAGESRIAEYVTGWLRDVGVHVELQEVLSSRPNVIARVGGTGHGRSLMLNAHLDTVGAAGMNNPFVPRVEGDRLYGRGAYDMKAGLAAIMLAARSVQRAGGAHGDVIVTAVMDEEYASAGTEAVLGRYRADGAIVTEPTGLRLCIAHKGFAWLSVTTQGRAAHGSKPDLGIDAIAQMGRVLAHLEALGKQLSQGPAHPLLGTGSVHASLIEGGQELSSYPERCRLQIERRTIPGETPSSVLEEILAELRKQSANDQSFRAEAELLFWREPFEVDRRAPIVQTVDQAAMAITGGGPQVYGDTPWMDAALLASAGIPTVVFGPGGAGAHAVVEWASISQTATCAAVLAQAAMDYCAGTLVT